MRTPVALAILALALLPLFACDKVRPLSGVAGSSSCNRCHGDEESAAPPQSVSGNTSTASVAVGAHRAHVLANPIAAPIDCSACHVKPSSIRAPGHMDGKADLTFGGLATANVSGARWDEASATCASTYCHGATLAGGSARTPVWTRVDGSQARCDSCHGNPPPNAAHAGVTGTCPQCHPQTVTVSGSIDVAGGYHLNGKVDVQGGHDAAWMDPASGKFHGDAAKAGLGSCQSCHGGTLEGQNGATDCAQCHGAGWKTDCTMCHGDRTSKVASPPTDAHGNSSPVVVTVGAHQVHVVRSGYACATCHVVPTDVFSPNHIDGPYATVTFGPPATANGSSPSWNRTTATCTGTWCHGKPAWGAATPPVWTAPGSVTCGSCHTLPPAAASGHPSVSSDLTGCVACHPASIDGSGRLIPASSGGKHLDGIIEAIGGHPAGWLNPSQHGAQANQGISACTSCHGADLSGGISGCSCDQCHVTATGGSGRAWRTDCTFCHGDSALGVSSPPRDVAGNTSTAAVTVGAHAQHTTASANRLSSPLACTICHPSMPVDVLSPGHIDAPAAEVVLPAGTWMRTTATCANTTCHARGGTAPSPVWTTVNGSQAACSSCHPSPPGLPHPPAAACGTCHGGGYDATAVVPSTHVDGTVTLVPGRTGCVSCHGDPTRTAIAGADANVRAAPPVDSKGNDATAARGVGAHAAHVNQATYRQNPIGCAECHAGAVPAAGDTSHADGTATIAFGTLATNASWGNVTPNPVWNGTACANTYCHGAFKNGAAAAITWTQSASLTCTSCHGAPPGGTHPANSSCGQCHPGYTATSVDRITHMNGALDASGATCTSCHGTAGGSATASNPLLAAPPSDTAGASTGIHVGAHQAHLVPGTYSDAFACQTCHADVGTYTISHSDGVRQVGFSGAANANLQQGTWFPGTATTAGTCIAWCHGDGINRKGLYAGGTMWTPSWTNAISGCDPCHGLPPITGRHDHAYNCTVCHPAPLLNKATHVNGIREVGGSGTYVTSWDGTTCTSTCHSGPMSWWGP